MRCYKSMVQIPNGKFVMGSDKHYPEEAPTKTVLVEAFHMDIHTVSNRDFTIFINETGYITTAEQAVETPASGDLPLPIPEAGSLVFHIPQHKTDLKDATQWWHYVKGACWKRPEGMNSDIIKRQDHPVVQVSHVDALAYCAWAKKSLPTEAEWEFAAKAGSPHIYPWGKTLLKDNKIQANTWHGNFPIQNKQFASSPFSMPVDSYESSSFGLFNMIGNVWEWTVNSDTMITPNSKNCCSNDKLAKHSNHSYILKGGSFLCAENYCRRYRPAAKLSQNEFSSTNHIGFRCVARS